MKENAQKTTMTKWIERMFNRAKEKHWYETYWCIDIHGTISCPDYRRTEKSILYYPYAKETLKLLTDRDDIVLILFTSSYPNEIEKYISDFAKDDIHFNYVNENPEINTSDSFGYYDKKMYFNVLFDDKAGFDPYDEWENLYYYLLNTSYRPKKEWKN